MSREERVQVAGAGQASVKRRTAFLQMRVTPQMHDDIARLALDHGNITIRALVMNALKQTYGLSVPNDELGDRRGRSPAQSEKEADHG
ncbi:hypothetical protein SAMN05518849_11440 [Sphingobium sp. AP50]|uniref:hypothetical protein n=1 Tax=Sphingobium sp. AP50 TaxID=1884369 RepID=UPI0008B1F6CD|nr:hypothetical protein [Sphingobium sp. AP50]SEJ80657.1 hypothetical protein SAMN05518849_11440 [Sphingobium sp. AP50]